jgi:hypothetical protein
MFNCSPISSKVFLVGVLVALSSSATAYPGKRLQLEQLVAASDLIVVVDLSNIQSIGTTEERVDGNPITADSYRADVHVLRSLKGSSPDRFTIVFYTPQVFVGYPGITTGLQMAFLKRQKGGYVFADRHYPVLPASDVTIRQSSGSLAGPLGLVVEELGRVISSAAASPRDKWMVLARAYGIPKLASFAFALQLGLQNTNDDDLRCRMEAELISRDDLSQLNSVGNLLLKGSFNEKQKELLLSVITNEVKNPDASPVLARLLHSDDAGTRRAGAEALWHSASPSAVPELLKALLDQDERVRFYAVRALADLNDEPKWGPSFAEFQERQQQYLSHWQDWATSRPQHGH